jgi:hypothetical protein
MRNNNLKLALNRIATVGTGQVRLNRVHGRSATVFVDGLGRLVVERTDETRRNQIGRRVFRVGFVRARLDIEAAGLRTAAALAYLEAAAAAALAAERTLRTARANVDAAANAYRNANANATAGRAPLVGIIN